MNIVDLIGKIVLDGADKAEKQLNRLADIAKNGVNKAFTGVSDTLNDMGEAILDIFGNAESQIKSVTGFVQENRGAFSEAGNAINELGSFLTNAFSSAVQSAKDEEESINRLKAALGDVGISYDEVKSKIESAISATENKTNYSDSEQRNALADLINTTSDYQNALDQLDIAVDLAASKQISLSDAANVVGQVATGQNDILSQFGIKVTDGASAMENLAQMENDFSGAAEEAADPITIMQSSFGDLVSQIGGEVIPSVEDISGFISNAVDNTMNWIETNPALSGGMKVISGLLGEEKTKWIESTIAVVARTVASIAAIAVENGLGMAMKATWAIMAANPMGAIITIIGLLVAAGVALWQNWDKVKNFFSEAWETIKVAFAYGVKFLVNTVLAPFIEFFGKMLGGLTKGIGAIVGIFNKDLGASISSIGDKLMNARKEISDWADNIIDAKKVKEQAEEASKAIQEWAEEQKSLAEQQLADKTAQLEEEKGLAQTEYDQEMKRIEEVYGAEEELNETKAEAARRVNKEEQDALDDKMEAEREAYDERIAMIDSEYEAKMKLVDEEAAAQLKLLQNQIDAIDAAQEAEDEALEEQENAKRRAKLVENIGKAKTDKDKKEAENELAEYDADMEVKNRKKQRSKQIQGLRDQMGNVREQASAEKDRLQEERDAKKEQEETLLADKLNRLQTEKDALDTALVDELKRIEDERVAAETAAKSRLDYRLQCIADEEKRANERAEQELKDIQAQVEKVNAETAKLQDRTITITTIYEDKHVSSGGGGLPDTEDESGTKETGSGDGGGSNLPISTSGYPGYIFTPNGIIFDPVYSTGQNLDSGGVIHEPTLLTRLSDMRPYAIAVKNGLPETITPMGTNPQSVDLRIYFDSNLMAEKLGVKLVDKIRVRTGRKN